MEKTRPHQNHQTRHQHIDISTYDDDPIVAMLATTIAEHHRDGQHMPISACWTMARAAIWLDAAVIPSSMNELHMLPQSSIDDDGQVVTTWTPFMGINYWRRIGQERGGYEIFDARPMNLDELRMHNMILAHEERVTSEDVASVVKVKSFTSVRRAVNELGVKYWDYMKQAPQGVGIVRRSEMRSGKPPIGKTWRWVAAKRAEADALRKEFPLMPNVGKSRYHVMYEQMLDNLMLSAEFEAKHTLATSETSGTIDVMPSSFPSSGKVKKFNTRPTREAYTPSDDESVNALLFGFD